MATENKYLISGVSLLALAMLAVVFEPFKHLPQPVVFILYAVLIMPGVALCYAAKWKFVKIAEGIRPAQTGVVDTAADKKWRMWAIGTGLAGAVLAYVGRLVIMHTNQVLPSVLGWVSFLIGSFLVGAALVFGKVAGI